jgi:hypothetical protein
VNAPEVRRAAPGRALGGGRWRPRKPKAPRTAGNRLLWTIVGAVLLLAGVGMALSSAGTFGTFGVDRDRPLVTDAFADRWSSWDGWAWAVAIAVALLVALLGFLLLRAELRGRGGGALADRVLAAASGVGQTRVSSTALTRALTRDLQHHPGVRRAGVRFAGRERRPEVYLNLTVTPEADIGSVREHVDSALSRFEATSGWRPDLADVTVAVPAKEPQRVH